MSPTIIDVAKKAKVSSGAASEIVNSGKTHKYSPDTVERVKKAAAALGYNVHHFAKSLRTQRTGIIGILCKSGSMLGSFYEPYISDVYQGVGNFLAHKGMNIIFQQVPTLAEDGKTFGLADSKIVDGYIVILYSSMVDTFVREYQEHPRHPKVPLVIIHSLARKLPFAGVGVDCRKAGDLATRHLLEHGYPSIGLVAPQGKNIHTWDFEQGYKKALKQEGMPFNNDLIFRTRTFGTTHGYRLADELLAAGEKLPRALAFADDTLAFGMMKRFQEEGIKVPDDIAMVGFGDWLHPDFVCSDLTSIRQPGREKGETAARLLLDILNNNGAGHKKQTVILEPKLTIRRSCGCLTSVDN